MMWLLCWPTGVLCGIFVFFSFLPMACPGIQIFVSIGVYSRLYIGIFGCLLSFFLLFVESVLSARMAARDWCCWCYACMYCMR
jgi:hypothetical protein